MINLLDGIHDDDNDNEARNEETYLLQHQGTTVSITTTASTYHTVI
jgi:hypothetical protein